MTQHNEFDLAVVGTGGAAAVAGTGPGGRVWPPVACWSLNGKKVSSKPCRPATSPPPSNIAAANTGIITTRISKAARQRRWSWTGVGRPVDGLPASTL